MKYDSKYFIRYWLNQQGIRYKIFYFDITEYNKKIM